MLLAFENLIVPLLMASIVSYLRGFKVLLLKILEVWRTLRYLCLRELQESPYERYWGVSIRGCANSSLVAEQSYGIFKSFRALLLKILVAFAVRTLRTFGALR